MWRNDDGGTEDDQVDEPLGRAWIGVQLLTGVAPEAVADRLIERGVEKCQAQRHVAQVAEDPAIGAGLARAWRGEKLASLMQALARQLRQSAVAEAVPVEDGISPGRFYNSYYFANRPVVIRGLMDDWPALRRWSPEQFGDRYGDEVVEVSAGRDADARYEDRFSDHRRRMTMRNLVDTVIHSAGNDVYLVAKNRLLEQPAFASLRDDFWCPAGILTTDPGAAPARMWFGGAGTVTPLHHDASNILFGQVYGRKLVRLIPPYEIENVYNDRTCFSDVDLDDIDFERFPCFRRVTVVEATVGPGDFLLLPLGWWHQVRSLEVSISLSFQNFAVPGRPVVWDYPT